VSRSSRIKSWALGAAVLMAALPAQGQSNLDAGKSPAQIFADTCNACHRGPRELKPTSAWFLRQHYTTGTQEAANMAAYLAAVGSDPRAAQQRRQPGAGAGRGTATEATSRGTTSPATSDRGKQPETQAATPGAGNGRRTPATPEQAQSAPGATPDAAVKPRRSSEGAEASKPPGADVQGHGVEAAAPSQAAAAVPTRPQPLEEFEE
jgi:hypothetical protein